jgi:pyruvate/2-oxoglutarate dehydrogenase complex dihydrolipoamide acyltransferase (E2) component
MTLEDMAGGTFTISNGGIYGSLMGKSISHFSNPKGLQLSICHRRPYWACTLRKTDQLL